MEVGVDATIQDLLMSRLPCLTKVLAIAVGIASCGRGPQANGTPPFYHSSGLARACDSLIDATGGSQACKRAVDSGSASAAELDNYASTLLGEDDSLGALKSFRAAIRDSASDLTAYDAASHVLAARHEVPAAIALLDSAEAVIASDSPSGKHAVEEAALQVDESRLFGDVGKTDSALAHMLRARPFMEASPDLRLELGLLLLKAARYDTAILVLQSVALADPVSTKTSSEAWGGLAEAFYRTGRPGTATALWGRARSAEPNYFQIHPDRWHDYQLSLRASGVVLAPDPADWPRP